MWQNGWSILEVPTDSLYRYLLQFTIVFVQVKLELVCAMLKIIRLVLGSNIWSLFALTHNTSWPNSKLGQVVVGSNIAEN